MASKDMADVLQIAVACVGEEKLGIKQGDIRTHLIRLDTVMALYLEEC